MKIYNVKVYNINQYYTTLKGKDTGKRFVSIEKIDNIMVTKGLLGVREIITGFPVIIYDKNYILNKKYLKFYKKHRIVLGINKSSLELKNLVIASELDEYKNNFVWSNFRKIIKVYNSQKEIDKKIANIKRKIK